MGPVFSFISSLASILSKLIPDHAEMRRRKIVQGASKDRDLVRRWALRDWLRDDIAAGSAKQKRVKAHAKAGFRAGKKGGPPLV